MELWDLYDSERHATGRLHQRGRSLPSGAYHLVADVWTITSRGEILITQRHPHKRHGLLWECTGGAVLAGENTLAGAVRELAEEIGVCVGRDELTLMHSVRLNDRFVDTYLLRRDITLSELRLQPEEVVDARLVTIGTLTRMWNAGLVVPRERFGQYRDSLEQLLSVSPLTPIGIKENLR